MTIAKRYKLKKAKSGVNSGAVLAPSWELAIADAEERIAQLHRSIEIFKHNLKAQVPFPESATRI
jgi:hypothetical protein